ncbi:hypothetical protein [Moheibacter lacus]|uniref:Uncharacterized protein n=1 Tax=Moheibacter lacus TaxID=2745851 RepID=A0A838ZTU4_9FLAO|nr:hypothetical protein [Moheibacter lacus]MBA5630425.1 hypothetical protein [Moheibacter lacus]
METPKFLIADNSDFPDKIFIIHTDFPRFMLDVETEEIEWFDELEEEPDVDLETEIAELMEKAFDFFDREMDTYDEE